MYNIYSDIVKQSHPYYQLMDLGREQLLTQLTTWSRLELIDWLSWNDRNGLYTDEDSLREFDNILSKEEAIQIIVKQITES